MKIIDFPVGLTFHVRSQDSEFYKEFKKILNVSRIAWFDPCCPANDLLPVAFDTVSGVIERFDVTTKTFIPITNPNVTKAGTAKAVNVTGGITALELSGGLITSTSAAAVLATLPTATALATQLGAVQGTRFTFVVDNSAGANTVTVGLGAGITVNTPVILGTDTLTVSTANVVGVFEVVFTSTTAAIIFRIA
jgi:hypothetical protein